jgi:hypothetical protein
MFTRTTKFVVVFCWWVVFFIRRLWSILFKIGFDDYILESSTGHDNNSIMKRPPSRFHTPIELRVPQDSGVMGRSWPARSDIIETVVGPHTIIFLREWFPCRWTKACSLCTGASIFNNVPSTSPHGWESTLMEELSSHSITVFWKLNDCLKKF